MTPWERRAVQEIQTHLEKLLSEGGRMHYKKGHVIFYEGHNAYGFYVLKKGVIDLSQVGMEGKSERLPIPSNYKNGSLFGLFHLLTNSPYCATAIAKEDVEVLFIPKSVVIDFLKKAGLLNHSRNS